MKAAFEEAARGRVMVTAWHEDRQPDRTGLAGKRGYSTLPTGLLSRAAVQCRVE
jgi:hypothetical protein